MILLVLTIILSKESIAQNGDIPANVSFELGNGLQISSQNGNYVFGLGGMIQPTIGFEQIEDNDADYFLNSRRSYFNIQGKAVQEKVSFLIQTDFSLTQPLLDAWLSYQVHSSTAITVGQKQTIGNNREMMIMEDQLQFVDRSLLSSQFSASGREFGLYIDSKIQLGEIILKPSIAVTSGDGRNSFGSDSRDVDLGGMKYAARLDILPLGAFTENNDLCIADLAHEERPKLVIGAAASYNDGASNITGEGHGDFLIYNIEGKQQLPDYRQLYADILFKFKGISVLGEYVIATATSLEQTYTDNLGQAPLLPTQISEFLALGSGYNATVGYTLKKGYGLDIRYSAVQPEFEFNPNSLVGEWTETSVGFSRYLKGNSLKLHASISQITNDSDQNITRGNLMFQLRF